MTRTLFVECDYGISGDMMVGALLDAGASEVGLHDAIKSLGLDGFDIAITRKMAGAMAGCDFDVRVDAAHENHDHDMTWLFGDLDHDHAQQTADGHHHHGHGCNHGHEDGHGHGHENHGRHHQGHHHGHHHHEHRNLADIRLIVERSSLPRNAKDVALRIFGIVAEAEAKAHGSTVEEVHFHEVGAVDSIVDVAAVAWCLDDLGIDDVVFSPLVEGEGHIRSAHGILPIPVPAVAHIVEAHGLVLRRAHRHAELITPTGAAIAAATRSRDSLPEQYRIVSTGLGTGKRAYDPPSTLRVMLVEDADESVVTQVGEGQLWKLETEVDDCTGEALAYALDRLYEVGAREAHFIPVVMKKNRPGHKVEVLCTEDAIGAAEQVLFEDTTTIGIRRYPVERTVLAREAREVSTCYGLAQVKEVTLPSGRVRAYPEHDSVAAIAAEQGIPYQEALRAVLAAL